MCSHYIYFLYVVYMFSIHMFIYIFHIYLRSFTVHSLLFYSRIYYFLRFCFSIWKLDTLAFSCSDFIYIYTIYVFLTRTSKTTSPHSLHRYTINTNSLSRFRTDPDHTSTNWLIHIITVSYIDQSFNRYMSLN